MYSGNGATKGRGEGGETAPQRATRKCMRGARGGGGHAADRRVRARQGHASRSLYTDKVHQFEVGKLLLKSLFVSSFIAVHKFILMFEFLIIFNYFKSISVYNKVSA